MIGPPRGLVLVGRVGRPQRLARPLTFGQRAPGGGAWWLWLSWAVDPGTFMVVCALPYIAYDIYTSKREP